ncbi:MAG: ErfK/YbiS/YcfS/YnhG family protein [Frankiales bacterium]|nr:ErfK/YbiS/YcfS/YnhG family protein [Frankiales bacterium]
MTTTLPDGAPRRLRPRLLAGLVVGVLATGAGLGWAGSRPDHVAVQAASLTPIPVPVLTTVGQTRGQVPWNKPLAVSVVDGTLHAVTAVDPDGKTVPGTLSATGWRSSSTLLPAATYRLTATVVDKAGKFRAMAVSTRTTPPIKTIHSVLTPGDGDVVGVGMTVIVNLDHEVTQAADRAAVEQRLTVTTTPAVTGAWRWMSPTELHYRGPSYWAAGTKINTRADFTHLQLSDGTWGQGVHTTSYSIGARVISTVDVTKHVMTVVQNGKLLRTVKVSTGRDKYPTKGGVHLVLEKTKLKIMDSATVGIPRNSPDGYYEKVPDSVRISYAGAFVHSAGWSVGDQGIRNVSHGCVNISPTDAAWFFNLVRRGDVVDVIHAAVGPTLSDPGMSDWNIPFRAWGN